MICISAHSHLGAEEERGEVVPRGAFPRPGAAARRAEDPPVREDDLHVEAVLLHGAVADGVGAAGPGGDHAADGGVRAGVHREPQAVSLQGLQAVYLDSGQSLLII